MIVNRANLNEIFTGFKAAFNTGFTNAKPDWQGVATPVPSSTKEEKYGWMGQFPKLREWMGDRQVQNLKTHDYSIKNRKFESTIEVLRDDIDDDTYGVYKPLMEEMGFAAATHPDELVFTLLTDGFVTPCYDGKNFFAGDHKVGKVNVSNTQAGAGKPWFLLDASRPLKPIIFQKRREYELKSMNQPDDEAVFLRDSYRFGVDARVNVGFGFWQQAFGSKATLDAGNFAAALEAMMAFKSDEGRPLGIRPTLLVIGPSNRSAALEIVKAERNASGATNINRDVVEILISPWLE